MTHMCQKLIGSVLIATLIYGNDAACMSQAELQSLAISFQAQLSAACAVTFSSDSGSGNAPECTTTSSACGISMSITTTMNCTGVLCSMIPAGDLAPRSVPMQNQICVPDPCNSNDDKGVYLSYMATMVSEQICNQAGQGLEAQKATLAEQGISLELSVMTGAPKMSCDKNSNGEIVIDGVVIPATSPDDNGQETRTCMDVTRAYKANGCCGNPNKELPAGGLEGLMRLRRLLSGQNIVESVKAAGLPDLWPRRRLSEDDELLESVKAALRRAEAEGGEAEAKKLAQSMLGILAEHA